MQRHKLTSNNLSTSELVILAEEHKQYVNFANQQSLDKKNHSQYNPMHIYSECLPILFREAYSQIITSSHY